MKKKATKLRLRKETLRSLDSGLEQVGGASLGLCLAVATKIILDRTIQALTPNTCCASYCVTDPPTCLCTAPEVCCPEP